MHQVAPWTIISSIVCGCSGAPADSDIKAALQAEQRWDRAKAESSPHNGGMARPMTGLALFEVVSVRKRSCVVESVEAYRCDVEIEIRKDNLTFNGTLVSLRLVKGSEGWVAQR